MTATCPGRMSPSGEVTCLRAIGAGGRVRVPMCNDFEACRPVEADAAEAAAISPPILPSPVPLRVRRLGRKVAIERGSILVGGQRALATVLHVSERSVRGWLGFDRDIGDGVLLDTADALEAHAIKCQAEAAAIRLLVQQHKEETE